MSKFNIKFSIYIFIALLSVNRSNAMESYPQTHVLPTDTVYDCYITDVFNEAGETYIKIRPIKFLWGFSAIIEAKKDGVAEYEIDKVTKDTTWWVPNDYHIVARDKTEYKFIISDKVKVSVCDPVELKKITVKELLSNPSYYKIQLYDRYTHEKSGEIDYSPYIIVVENGEVTIIQDIYVP